jgi:hypothetical protein
LTSMCHGMFPFAMSCDWACANEVPINKSKLNSIKVNCFMRVSKFNYTMQAGRPGLRLDEIQQVQACLKSSPSSSPALLDDLAALDTSF